MFTLFLLPVILLSRRKKATSPLPPHLPKYESNRTSPFPHNDSTIIIQGPSSPISLPTSSLYLLSIPLPFLSSPGSLPTGSLTPIKF